jgi:tRNA (guanine37-N1)-methyltransferase
MDVLAFLQEKDELSYIDLIEPLRLGQAEVLIAEKEGVLIRINDDALDGVLFDERLLSTFTDILVGSDAPIAVHDGILVDTLKAMGMAYHFPCFQAVYTKSTPFVLSQNLTIRELGMDDLPVVLANYKNADEAYITGRVQSGSLIGAQVDGELAAFIGQHAELTIGLLEVLPAYRRRHIGEELEKAYINRLLAHSRVPFCHVTTHNEASLALQKKLGMTFGKHLIHWFN